MHHGTVPVAANMCCQALVWAAEANAADLNTGTIHRRSGCGMGRWGVRARQTCNTMISECIQLESFPV